MTGANHTYKAHKVPKRPRDTNQLAKLMLDIATGEKPKEPERASDGKDPAAVALGRKGGLKGGKARAAALSPAQRKAAAKKAAKARWKPKSQSWALRSTGASSFRCTWAMLAQDAP